MTRYSDLYITQKCFPSIFIYSIAEISNSNKDPLVDLTFIPVFIPLYTLWPLRSYWSSHGSLRSPFLEPPFPRLPLVEVLCTTQPQGNWTFHALITVSKWWRMSVVLIASDIYIDYERIVLHSDVPAVSIKQDDNASLVNTAQPGKVVKDTAMALSLCLP